MNLEHITILIGLSTLLYAIAVDLRSDNESRPPARASIALGVGIACVLGGITVARAADFEASIGKTSGTVGPSYSVGLTGIVRDNLRWRSGVSVIGAPSVTRTGTASDYADDIQAGEGSGPYTWTPGQTNKELYATIAPEIHRGNWTFSVEGGLGIYRPVWNQDLMPGASTDTHSTPLAITPIIGASVGWGKTSLVFSYQRMKTAGDNDSMRYSQTQETISVRERF